MADCEDNAFEFITGEKIGCATFSQKKFVNKLKRYIKDYPNDIEVVAENDDGSICVRVPVSWFKISPPRKRELSEEERAAAAERMRIAREKKKNENIQS